MCCNKLLMMMAKRPKTSSRDKYAPPLTYNDHSRFGHAPVGGIQRRHPVTLVSSIISGLGLKGHGQEARGGLREQQCRRRDFIVLGVGCDVNLLFCVLYKNLC